MIRDLGFVCPLDSLPLEKIANSWRCGSGHVFDIAKEGYCNLLPVQNKGSIEPGDDKEMVAARKRFLDLGHYAPIADSLFEWVKKSGLRRVVDAGCGEGYYLDHIYKLASVSPDAPALELAGFDISKWAVRAAAKRNRNLRWAVASNRQLPFAEVDLILSLFGFPIWESFRKVQGSGAAVLLVDPGPDHLLELRELIYPVVRKNPPPSIQGALEAGYRLKEERSLRFSFLAENLSDLLRMTPHAYKISATGAAALAQQSKLTITADISFRFLRLP